MCIHDFIGLYAYIHRPAYKLAYMLSEINFNILTINVYRTALESFKHHFNNQNYLSESFAHDLPQTNRTKATRRRQRPVDMWRLS